MKKERFRMFGAALLALTISACSEHQAAAPPIAQAQFAPSAAAPAPALVMVQAAPAQNGMQDMLTGAAIGALATHAMTGPSRQVAVSAPVVHNTTIVQKTVVVKPSMAPSAPPPSSAPSVRPSSAMVVAKAMPSYSPPKTAAPASYKVSYSIPSSGGRR